MRSESGLVDVTGAFPAITGTTLNRGTYEMIAPGKIRLPADVTNNKATILVDGATGQLQDTVGGVTAVNGLANLTVNSGSITCATERTRASERWRSRARSWSAPARRSWATSLNQSVGHDLAHTRADAKLQTSGGGERHRRHPPRHRHGADRCGRPVREHDRNCSSPASPDPEPSP